MTQIFSAIGIGFSAVVVGLVLVVAIGAWELRGMSMEDMENYECN